LDGFVWAAHVGLNLEKLNNGTREYPQTFARVDGGIYRKTSPIVGQLVSVSVC